jgi:hypothetical protein
VSFFQDNRHKHQHYHKLFVHEKVILMLKNVTNIFEDLQFFMVCHKAIHVKGNITLGTFFEHFLVPYSAAGLLLLGNCIMKDC